MARFAALVLLALFAFVALAAAQDGEVDMRNRKLLSANGAAKADGMEWKHPRHHKKGKPSYNECVAAASASADSFASGDGEAFSESEAIAETASELKKSGFKWGSPEWKRKFTQTCWAKASARAVSYSSSRGGGFASASAEASASAGSGGK